MNVWGVVMPIEGGIGLMSWLSKIAFDRGHQFKKSLFEEVAINVSCVGEVLLECRVNSVCTV